MSPGPVFPQENSLPCPKSQAIRGNGDRFRRPGKRHLNVAGHVIRPLIGMHKIRIVLRHQPVHPSLQVPPGTWVGILHQNQAARGMPAKDLQNTSAHSTSGDKFSTRFSDFNRPRPSRRNDNLLLQNFHSLSGPPSFNPENGWPPPGLVCGNSYAAQRTDNAVAQQSNTPHCAIFSGQFEAEPPFAKSPAVASKWQSPHRPSHGNASRQKPPLSHKPPGRIRGREKSSGQNQTAMKQNETGSFHPDPG